MNNTFSEAAYRRAHAQANSKDPRSMMIAAHRDPVRISASQVPKAAKGGYDFMQAALSRPIQTQPPPQYRRVSAIPKPVQRKIIVHQDHPVKKVNMTAPRTQPQIIPSTPDTINPGRPGSASSTARTISVRRSPTTYWRGLPFVKRTFLRYAQVKGLDVRTGDAQMLDDDETWVSVRDRFHEETGVRMSVRELGRSLPILAFYSNREMDRITQRQKVYIRRFLLEMGYAEDFPLVWYAKKVE